MLWFVWLLMSILGGFLWLVSTRAGQRLSMGEAIFCAIPVGVIGSAWIVYLIGCITGLLSEAQTWLVIGGAFFTLVDLNAALDGWERIRRKAGGWRLEDSVVTGMVLAISLWLYPIYSMRMIPEKDGNIWSGGSCYGDLPIHMTIAQSFLVGVNTQISWGSMISPIFAGEHMTYPFLPDFHAAILVRLGSSMRHAFLWPGFLMALSLWALIAYLTIRMTRSRVIAPLLAVALVIGAGGLGGWRWIASVGWDEALKKDVIQHDPISEWTYLWFALIPHILLPQRGGNFAYPLAMLCLLYVWMATDSTVHMSTRVRRSLLVCAALFAAMLPMVQAHAFIGCGVIIGTVFLLDFHKWAGDARILTSWLLAGLVAAGLGLPQMQQFRNTVSSGFYGKFLTYGWLFNNYEHFGTPHHSIVGFFRFWWYSLGPTLPLFLLALVLLGLEAGAALRLQGRLTTAYGRDAVRKYVQSSRKAAQDAGFALPLDCDEDSSPETDDGRTHVPLTPLPSPTPTKTPEPAPALTPKMVGYFTRHLIQPFTDMLDSILGAVLGRALARIEPALQAANALPASGRALDAIKFGIGAFGVFMLGNYINFQPWDRDNAKLFYIFIFVCCPIIAGLLATPLEAVLGGDIGPGAARPAAWLMAVGATDAASAVTHSKKDKPAAAVAGHRTGARGYFRLLSLVFTAVALFAFALQGLSGWMMVIQEFYDGENGGGVLLDRDSQAVGNFFLTKVHPKAVTLHSNAHIQPSGALAGRPSLVAYYGWVSNHGYNSFERLGDRDAIMNNLLKDSDINAYNLCRKWGVRYIVGEHLPTHARRLHDAWEQAQRDIREGRMSRDDLSDELAQYDPDVYLDGQVRRIFRAGRFEVLEVQGYGFPPG